MKENQVILITATIFHVFGFTNKTINQELVYTALPLVWSKIKNEFVMARSYVSITCSYNKSLDNKVFYMILSWDPDNALAYLYNNNLVQNSLTPVYNRAHQEGLNVDRVSGESKLILTIREVSIRYQELNVICLVKDDDGRGAVVWKKTIILKVIEPPKILPFAHDEVNVTRGDAHKIELACTASGFPPPTVRWVKRMNNKLVEPQTFDPRTLTARCLLPTPFTAGDDDNFLCEATTKHHYMEAIGLNRVISAVRINVQYAPEIQSKLHVAYTDIGQRVNITIPVSGNPQPVLSCSVLSIHSVSFVRVSGHPSPHRFLYLVVVPRVKPALIRDFPCRATNFLGSATTSIRVQLIPSRPVILSPSGTPYSDYYGLRWSAFSGSSLVNATIEVTNNAKRNRQVSSQIVILPAPSLHAVNQTFLSHVVSLHGDSFYSVRLSSCNLHGCSVFSRPVSFRTLLNDGTNTVDPLLIRPPTTLATSRVPYTGRPTRVREYNQVVKRCDSYGFGDSECGVPALYPSLPLFVILFIASVVFCC